MTLPDFSNLRILVVGDVMLDRYQHGTVTRVSPEAPVPVVNIGRLEDRLGGAANVARNIASLGAGVRLYGVVGGDYEAGIVRDLLDQAGIAGKLRGDKHMPTTRKTRVIAQRQQLLRMDVEGKPGAEVMRQVSMDFDQAVDECDMVVLSDYDKGVLEHADRFIAMAKDAGKPVHVDPKGRIWSKYARADLIKPNLAEMQAQIQTTWTTEKGLLMEVDRVRQSLRAKAILVTRGADGMTLFTPSFANCDAFHQSAITRAEVFDVSGAGDTVMAVMAVMGAANAPILDAMKVASAAAGIVVGRIGTSAVTRAELEEALAHA